MAKQENKNEKNIHEMDDIEFLAYADYITSPYYREYYEAKKKAALCPTPSAYSNAGEAAVSQGKYKRRGGALIFMALFMLLIIAVAVFSYLNIGAIDAYVAPFKTAGETGKTIAYTDSIFGLLKKFDILDQDSTFYTDCLTKLDSADTMGKIAYYGLPIASALVLIFALAIFISALAGAGKKSVGKGLVNKKVHLILVSILQLVFSVLIALFATVWDGVGMAGFVDFITMATNKIVIGYGLYAIIGLSLLSLICNLFAYKKIKIK